MYSAKGLWDNVSRVRKLMRDQGVEKEPACSLVEAENKFHVFLVDDTAHPEVNAVYNYLKQLGFEMRISGYVPDTRNYHFTWTILATAVLGTWTLFAGCAHSFLCVALATAVLGTWTPGLEGDFTRVG
ncbi:unnamed protein product [Linum trigynum]|uniref:Pentatricopeptide repeat-containing protein n=1 Tax=Linum trigynum TaxID=586398 RepID=A0AAV2CKR7_9ROSI